MISLLTQEQTDALRSIGDSALVLFAMAMVDANYPGRITKPAELLPYLHPTYKDVRKLTTQLNALSASGRLAQSGAGYVLLDGGRALLLEMSGTALPDEDLALSSPAQAAGTVLEAQALDADDTSQDVGGSHGEISTRAMRVQEKTLKKEEESLIPKELKTSSSKTAQNVRTEDVLELAPGVTTARILRETSRLDGFGEDGVFLHGLDVDTIHPQDALGWIAQAFHQRARLGSPAGLVYSRLKNPEQPKARAKYVQDWESYLPDDFLIAIGWLDLKCATCEQTFDSMDALEAHHAMMFRCEYQCSERFHTREELDAHHATHEPTIVTYCALPDADRGAQAWALVKKTLAGEMPKAAYETWVRDGEAVRFADRELTVVVQNAFVADWLRSRLAAKINAMLWNYLLEEIRVLFVVGVLDVE